MNSSISNKTDPAILLRNEIEILFTQIRLMELYVKRAQASAAHEADHLRRQHQSELALLRADLEQKEQALAARELEPTRTETVFNSLQTDSNAVINDLRGQLAEQQALASQSDFKLKQAKSRITEILEQKTQFELVRKQTERLQSAQAEQMRAGVRAEIELLESQLEQREVELQTKQTLLERHNEEAQKINFAAECMRQRIAEQEATIRRFEEQTAPLESERLRQAEAELTELRGMEQSFNARIQELQTQLAEKQALLENAIGPFGSVNRC